MAENRVDVYKIDYQTLGIENLEKSLRSLDGIDDVVKKLKKELSATDIKTDKFDALNRAIAETKVQRSAIVAQQKAVERALVEPAQFAEGSYRQLNAQLIQTKNRYKDLSEADRNSPFGREMLKNIGSLDTNLKAIDATMGQHQRNVGNYRTEIIGALSQISPNLGNLAGGISNITGQAGGLNALSVGLAGIGLAAATAQKALTINAQVSDLKSDVVKTANLSKQEIDDLVEKLKGIDTRTSIQELLKISAIGGQFGVEGADNVLKFSKAVDVLNIALGDEFGGNAETVTKEIGGLSNVLFGATKDGDVFAQNLTHIGNAINELSANGSATAPVITDFASRIGRVGRPAGLTNGFILGLSATLQELNVNAEQGGTAVTRLLTSMQSDRANFAKTLGLDLQDFTNLLNTDADAAFKLVIERVKELSKSKTDLSDILKQLKIDGAGELSVFLALAENQQSLGRNTGLATEKLKEENSILNEANEKNTNLAASVEKLGNALDNAFVSSGAESGLKGIVDLLTVAVGPALKFAGGVLSVATNFDKLLLAKKAYDSVFGEAKIVDATGTNSAKAAKDAFKNNPVFNAVDPISLLSKFNKVGDTSKQDVKKINPVLPKGDAANKGDAVKKDPQIKIKQDVENELAELEKASADRIEKIRQEAAKNRIAAISDDYTREVETEKARLGERILTIREAGQKIEADAKREADKLKNTEGVKQSQIDEILAKGKAERLKVEQASNVLYQSEFEQHRAKIAEIDEKYHQKTLERLDKQAKEKAKAVQSELDQELLQIENNANEAQRLNESARRKALIGQSEDKKRSINIEFDSKADDINADRLAKRLETLQKIAAAVGLANAASNNGGFGNLIDPSVLDKVFEQITSTERQITNAQIQENERRDRNDAETTERRLARQKSTNEQLAQIAFDGAQNVINGVFQLETIQAQAESEERTRTVEKEYAEKLKAAQGNALLTEQLEKELSDKKRKIEADSVREQAEISKTQAVVDGGLAIIKTLATVPFPGNLLAAAFIGVQTAQQVAVINAQTDRQLAALKGEQGLVVPLGNGRFEIGKDITGRRHSNGGELAMLNGKLVEAEAGERLDRDENGNLYVINRNSTARFRSTLDKIAGRTFAGKGQQLSMINQAGGGIPLARLGFSSNQSNLPAASAVGSSGKLEISLSDDAINVLANTIASRTGYAVEVGAMNGIDSGNRSRERQKLAADAAKL